MIHTLIRVSIAIAMFATTAFAEIRLHPLFADHAVLQREKPIVVWGTSTAGATISASLNNAVADAKSDSDGRWKISLPAMKAGGPYELVVKGDGEERVVKDVYLGEVWLASGQSNMDFTMSRSVNRWAGVENEEREIAEANHPTIREFRVPLTLADDPKETVEANWKVCSLENVPAFSAVGYYFARELNQNLGVPVGIITSAFGASCAQAWISREALEPQFKSQLDEYAQAVKEFNNGTAAARYRNTLIEWELACDIAEENGKPAPRKPAPPKNPQEDQHRPTLCYNAMIAPLRPVAFRGVIWYQGESNGWDHHEYLPLMQTLIADWRAKWENDFPFLFVQLAAHKPPATQPVASSQIASVREAQRLTLGTPNTAMAVTIDIGDAKDVHPHNKQEVGRRLALAARVTVYDQHVEHSGPLFKEAKLLGDRIEIAFDHAEGLRIGALSTTQPVEDPAKLHGFSILVGVKWSWANATIENDRVVIAFEPGQKPTEVRYAWADFPICNLYNAAGLPASPFRVVLSEP